MTINKIGIIGLGLIGGTLAKTIHRIHPTIQIIACDPNRDSLKQALSEGVITQGFDSLSTDVDCSEREDTHKTGKDSAVSALSSCRYIFLCAPVQQNESFLELLAPYLNEACILTDTGSVKASIHADVRTHGLSRYFIGGHPMAGREVGGYESSTDTLFEKASYLITPTERNKPENIALIRELAEHIGCKHIVTTTAQEHDAIIAYTSQLMHVVAVALCDNPMIERSTFFSAGSLRDCTRVAVINEKMWSELFLENKEELANRISEMQNSLENIKAALNNNDRDKLEEIMRHATQQKVKWLMN